jgi:hypothetical protein
MSATRIASEFILDGTLVNADINASAGIELTKLEKTVIAADGSNAFSGDQSFGGQKITNLGAPSSDNDGANKTYVDTAIASNIEVGPQKGYVVLKTQAALPACTYAGGGKTLTGDANGALSVNSTPVVDTWPLLIADQADGTQNGRYLVTDKGSAGTPFILTRAADFELSSQILPGAHMFVDQGTSAEENWYLDTDGPITLDTTSLTFTKRKGLTNITAGSGMTKSGDTINVIGGDGITANGDEIEASVDDSTIELDNTDGSGALRVKDGGITLAKMAVESVDSDQYVDGSIDSAHFAASSVNTAAIGDDQVTSAKLGSLAAAHEGFVHNGTNVVRGKRHFEVFNTDSFGASNPNKTFTLAGTPMGGVLEMLSIDGVVMVPGGSNDYTLSTATITMQRAIGSDQNCLGIFTEDLGA